MLDDVGEELEVVHVTEGVEGVVDDGEGDEDVDDVGQGGVW